MTDIVNLPRQNSAVTESGQPMSREWYNYFRRLETRLASANNTTTIVSGGSNTTTITTVPYVEQTIIDATTARTLSTGDANSLIEFTNAAAVTVTVEKNLSQPIPTDAIIYLTQGNTGQVTVVAGSGVTIDYTDSLKTRTTESTIGLKQIQADKWQLFGDTEPVAPALSVLVRSANSVGAPDFLASATDGHVLKRVSGALVWAAESGGGGSGNSYVPGGW